MKHQVFTIVGVMIERYRPQRMESLCYCRTLLLLLWCKYPCVRSMVIDRRRTRREEKWNATSPSDTWCQISLWVGRLSTKEIGVESYNYFLSSSFHSVTVPGIACFYYLLVHSEIPAHWFRVPFMYIYLYRTHGTGESCRDDARHFIDGCWMRVSTKMTKISFLFSFFNFSLKQICTFYHKYFNIMLNSLSLFYLFLLGKWIQK